MEYTHDHMAIVIQSMYPGAVHGRDFMVAHPLDKDGKQAGDPFIAKWKRDEPKPTDEQVKAAFMANATKFRATHVRRLRDAMLRKSDGKANPPVDAPADVQAKTAEWAAYRQALRDVTKQPGFPHNVEWPVAPK